MNAPTSSTAADKPVSLESEVEAEVSKLVEQKISRLDAERIRSSIVRLTSNSTDGLDSLSSELQALQKFIEFEVVRVQNEIESALAGIKIIIDTIAPWKGAQSRLQLTPALFVLAQLPILNSPNRVGSGAISRALLRRKFLL